MLWPRLTSGRHEGFAFTIRRRQRFGVEFSPVLMIWMETHLCLRGGTTSFAKSKHIAARWQTGWRPNAALPRNWKLKKVQARLFPQTLPQLKTLEYVGVCIQAREVGGDYYDFLNLGQERLGRGI